MVRPGLAGGPAIRRAVHISSFIPIIEGGGSRTARFLHFSVMEFLASYRFTSNGDAPPYPPHTICARACSGTLLRLDISPDNNNVVLLPNERGRPLKQSSSRCSRRSKTPLQTRARIVCAGRYEGCDVTIWTGRSRRIVARNSLTEKCENGKTDEPSSFDDGD